PVLTAAHVPLFWRYDLDRRRNPFLLERLGVHAVAGAGAIERAGRICLVARIEGKDRKSVFGVAEMRLTAHEDGFVYGLFGSERHDPQAPEGDTTRAVSHVGIVRTRDLVQWERLSDLRLRGSGAQSVALHPELVRGSYAFYTRAAGSGG